MIEREHQSLSVSRQCRLLDVSRSTLYYRPVGESAATLKLMRRIDELYLQYPFYGSRQMVRHLAREGVAVGRHRVRRLMRLLGLEAIYRKPRTSVANPEHRVYPYDATFLGRPIPRWVLSRRSSTCSTAGSAAMRRTLRTDTPAQRPLLFHGQPPLTHSLLLQTGQNIRKNSGQHFWNSHASPDRRSALLDGRSPDDGADWRCLRVKLRGTAQS